MAKAANALANVMHMINNNNNERPLTPKNMPPTSDDHAKLNVTHGGVHPHEREVLMRGLGRRERGRLVAARP